MAKSATIQTIRNLSYAGKEYKSGDVIKVDPEEKKRLLGKQGRLFTESQIVKPPAKPEGVE